jgi:hypothetical protein
MTIPKVDGSLVYHKLIVIYSSNDIGVRDRQFKVIPFGASVHDFEIMESMLSRHR